VARPAAVAEGGEVVGRVGGFVVEVKGDE
jgi:hypothetical protein